MIRMNKYLKQYEWSNIGAMLKNNKAEPKEITDTCKGVLVVITGATSGIGHEAARMYASRGADLLCINRNEEKSRRLKNEIEQEFSVSCRYHLADFTSLSDIHGAAQMLAELPENIDILIHNAGVFNTKRQFTPDGIEEVFQVNYLASFIINYTIKDKLKGQKKARILYVNSEGHRFAIAGLKLDDLDWNHHHYTGLKSYGSRQNGAAAVDVPVNRIFFKQRRYRQRDAPCGCKDQHGRK